MCMAYDTRVGGDKDMYGNLAMDLVIYSNFVNEGLVAFICICVCMYICMYVCMYVCMDYRNSVVLTCWQGL
jgi:hypothetical protein